MAVSLTSRWYDVPLYWIIMMNDDESDVWVIESSDSRSLNLGSQS